MVMHSHIPPIILETLVCAEKLSMVWVEKLLFCISDILLAHFLEELHCRDTTGCCQAAANWTAYEPITEPEIKGYDFRPLLSAIEHRQEKGTFED